MDLTIRIAERRDFRAIVEIYNQAVAAHGATADLEPVTLESRGAWFAEHDPARYPIFVAETGGAVAGWCSLSPYRPGRSALRRTAEISYYVHERYRRMGIASCLVAHAIAQGPRIGLKTLFAILLEVNGPSRVLLEKAGFREWGRLPRVAEIDGEECDHLYYGLRLPDAPDGPPLPDEGC